MTLVTILAAMTLACWAVGNWLLYVSDLNYVLGLALTGCFLAIVGSMPFVLFRKEWLAVVVGLLTIVIISLPTLKIDDPLVWIQREGFRAHVFPSDEYLSNCRLLTIAEDNELQQIGLCASLRRWGRRIDIVYDTSGKVLWPSAAMPPGLRAAAAKLFPSKLVASQATRTHIFGSFYAFAYVDQGDYPGSSRFRGGVD